MERLKSILVVHCALPLVSLMPAAIGSEGIYYSLWLLHSVMLAQLMALAVLLHLPAGRLTWKYVFAACVILVQTVAQWAAEGQVAPRLRVDWIWAISANFLLMFAAWMALLIALHGVLMLSPRFLGEIRLIKNPDCKELLRRQKQFSLLAVMVAVTVLAVLLGLLEALSVAEPDDSAAYSVLLFATIGTMCAAITLLGVWAGLSSRDAEFRIIAMFGGSAFGGLVISVWTDDKMVAISQVGWSSLTLVFAAAILMGMLMHLRCLQYRLVPQDWSEEP